MLLATGREQALLVSGQGFIHEFLFVLDGVQGSAQLLVIASKNGVTHQRCDLGDTELKISKGVELGNTVVACEVRTLADIGETETGIDSQDNQCSDDQATDQVQALCDTETGPLRHHEFR